MGAHLIGGQFQSDKYPACPTGKVPLSTKDPAAQDLLWRYAQRHRDVDAEFSDDLETALRNSGYVPPVIPKTPDGDRAAWLLSAVSSAGRTTINVEQYEELRALALSLSLASSTQG